MIILLMGVAGAGKSTIGLELSRILGWPMVDADSLHSPENVAKMHAGIPLSDSDRKPWLEEVAGRIKACVDGERNVVFACSALKEGYRRMLMISPKVRLVYLAVTPELARNRVANRTTHFMPASLVDSQFADLEVPKDALKVDASGEPRTVAKQILACLGVTSV